jgi:hypothetical protein
MCRTAADALAECRRLQNCEGATWESELRIAKAQGEAWRAYMRLCVVEGIEPVSSESPRLGAL